VQSKIQDFAKHAKEISPDVVGVIGAGLPPGLPPCFQFPNKSNINQVELVRISKGLEQMIGERATPQIGVECEFPDTLGGSECLAEGGRTDVCTKDGELTKSVELEAGRKGVQVVPGFSEAIITQVGKQELRASLGAKANRAEGRLKGQREEKGAQRNLAEHRLRK